MKAQDGPGGSRCRDIRAISRDCLSHCLPYHILTHRKASLYAGPLLPGLSQSIASSRAAKVRPSTRMKKEGPSPYADGKQSYKTSLPFTTLTNQPLRPPRPSAIVISFLLLLLLLLPPRLLLRLFTSEKITALINPSGQTRAKYISSAGGATGTISPSCYTLYISPDKSYIFTVMSAVSSP